MSERKRDSISVEEMCAAAGLVEEGWHPEVVSVTVAQFGQIEVRPVVIIDNVGQPRERTFTVLRPPRQILVELMNRSRTLSATGDRP